MSCKKKFTTQEAKIIRELLEKKGRVSRSEQKSIRATLRRMEFNISYFRKTSAAFDHQDFDLLIQNGLIEIVNEDGLAEKDVSNSTSNRKLIGHSAIEISEASEDLRQAFKPPKVEVLFIGESPPAGGTFFYNGNSKLY
nr:hypothetical protein [FCB group bacterium]